MASVRLRLRTEKKRSDGTCPIAISYTVTGEDSYRVHTGKFVDPVHWSSKSADSVIKASHFDYANMNIFLRGVLAKMNRIVDGYFSQYGEYPSVEYVRSKYDPPKEDDRGDFEQLWALFLERKTQKNKTPIKGNTYITNVKTRDRIREFAAYKGIKLTLGMIDKKFIDELSDWLVNVRNNSPNTTGSLFNILRTFLLWAEKYHDIDVKKLLIADLPTIKERKWFPYLELDEIRRIAEYDLKLNEMMARCRDAWVIQFCIGTRVSDLKALATGKKIIKEDDVYYYRFNDKKTDGLQSVPLASFVYKILDARLADPDWLPFENDINKNIKLVCAALHMDEKVSIKRMGDGKNGTIKGQYTDMEVPKWSTVTTHTARRSFVNNMRRLGVHDSVIGAITGQSQVTLQGYQHASRADKNEAMGKLNAAMGG